MDAGSQERLQDPPNSDIPRESEPSCLGKHETASSNSQTVDSNKNPLFHSQHDKRGQCAGKEQTHNGQNIASKCDMAQQEMGTEKNYTPPQGASGLEVGQVTDSGNTDNGNHFQIPKSSSLSSKIQRESESRFLRVCVPFLTAADITRIKKGLSKSEETAQTSGNGLKECDMEQEEMETENMWKLRSNRVEQIFSALNKQLHSFCWSRKLGLEFNVGFGPKQNNSVHSLKGAILLEIAKFALAINSSQQDFIMEILDYNFNLGLQSEHHRHTFACEVMDRARQLASCEDAVKLSNDVFELPVPVFSINVVNQNVGSVSSMKKCDVAPVCLPDSCAKSEEHIPQRTVDLYPWCKEIGLKLHVNSRQPHKKLESNTFTNGAMTEVMNFAEKLCGTFDQICLDILRHNFDLDTQNGDSDLARNILAQIPAIIEQSNLSSYSKGYRKLAKDVSLLEMVDWQNDPTFDACDSGSSSATMDQNEGRAVDIEYQNDLDAVSDGSSSAITMDQKMDTSGDSDQQTELDLKLWKLRANQIQQILSIPHEEHCPLYSYWRCKNSGIDFNVGSGVKRNLDPKLLTNGIMVELSTFAIELVSARRYFITDILEYNFNLNLKNEPYRTAFTQNIMRKVSSMCARVHRLDMPFELPDTMSIQEPTYNKTRFCPKCYQARNQKLHQHESDTGPLLIPSPLAMTHTVSTDGNCTAQNPSKAPSTSEETMMDSYPLCKKIGLDLCVNKHQPKDKLCNNVLTRGIMMEVLSFVRKLCGTKNKVINDLLEHNFNIRKQSKQHNFGEQFYALTLQKAGGLAWFDKVFVTHPVILKPTRYEGKVKRHSLMQGSEWKETIKKRKLALQTKAERNTLPSHNASVVKPKTVNHNMPYFYPICTEIGLDLDVSSKSGEKEKLDLNLLTTAVVVEINKFASKRAKHYFPGTVFDILDYNFDLSSQHHRRWEFTIATAFQVQALVKRYRNKSVKADKVFKLPFVFPPKSRTQKGKSKQYSQEEPNEKRNEGSSVHQVEYHSSVNCVNFPRGVVTYNEPWSHDEDTKTLMDPWRLNIQENSSQVSVGCGSPFQGNMHIKDEDNDPYYGDVKPEPYTEEEFSRHHDVKTESVAGEVTYLVPVEPQGTLENTGNQENFQESTSSEILTKLESSCHVICVPFTTTTDISATLPTVHQADECGLYGGEDQTQIPWNDKTDLPRISEPSCQLSYPSSLTSTELSSSLPAANFGMDPPLTSHPEDEKGLCGGEEQTQTTQNAQNTCDMAQEEIETENMWKLRANRIEQILSTRNTEFRTFCRSKKVGLEFNVGLGPKQNISGDSLTNAILLEIAKFALAINSSQQDFIMEILEYNFDLGLQSKHHRNIFACDIMDRVRQLKTNKDAVKVSNEVFELPGLMVSIDVGSVIPELSSILKIEKCDAPVCLPDSNAETSKHISCQCVGLYPWCKEIGLKLHVNSRQPHKKLEFNKLTNGAITEVTDFAEKLCGTFEQICLDILRHNFDLDLQNEDSDLARNILARIPVLIEQSNLLSCKRRCLKQKDVSPLETLDYQNQPNLNVCGSSSGAPSIDQNEGSFVENEQQNELNLKLWKLRANHMKRILSTPHEEHCPLYSYSRCKKLGIDFNVGSGEKQNLDSNVLTNGIIVELNNVATQLHSARKHFVTEILEHNFNLNLKNEACRTDFAEQTMLKIKSLKLHKRAFKISRSQFPFELPHMTCIQEPPKYCPKCYQYRTHKLHWDESSAGNMNSPPSHTMTKTVSAHSNCTAQNPAKDLSFTFSTVEDKIMDNYPCCKKIGLNLFVDRDQPKNKLDTHVLTLGAMFEVANFAQKLCGTKYKMIYELIKHNFDIGKHSQDLDPTLALSRWRSEKVVDLTWLNEVYVFNPFPKQPGHASKVKRKSDVHTSEWKEAIKKRKLALQTKEGCTLPSTDGSSGKSKTHLHCTGSAYPICTVIGLDLDVASKSRKKEKLDLKLLTRAVVMEIHTFATHQAGHYYPRTVFDILDYNFDLSSQYYRRWEFSIATASKVQSMVKQYCKREQKEVFTLPFVFDQNASQKFGENSNDNSKLGSQPGHSRWISEDEAHIQASTNVPHETDVEQEEMENYYTCPLEESDLDSDEVTGLRNTGKDPPYSSQLDKGFHDDQPNLDVCGSSSSSSPSIDQNEGRSVENEQQNELNLKLWKLRANHIKRILSTPHEEHCPFYPYSRCKKLGIDFNVGSGEKQNLDSKLMTNGIIVELNNFATQLQSAKKHFVTEILEYNFNLNLKNEACRTDFAEQTMTKINSKKLNRKSFKKSQRQFLFELPDITCIQEPPKYCPKCYQYRTHKLHWDESYAGNMNNPPSHTMTKTVSAHSNCTAQNPAKDLSFTFSTVEDKIMDNYPCCKKIGLNLFVDRDQPKNKLDTHVLTFKVMSEVASFAQKLCGTKYKMIYELIKHNFDIGNYGQDLNPTLALSRWRGEKVVDLTWLNEVYVFNPFPKQPGHASKVKRESDMHTSEWKEAIKKRKLALQTKEGCTLPSTDGSSGKSKTNLHCTGSAYPICTVIGLDLDVTSKSRQKEKLDLKLLTRAVVMEIHTFATHQAGHYPRTVFDILDYNFDLSSQYYRRWEFSIATASNFQTIAEQYCEEPGRADKVFRLPFVFDPKVSENFVQKRQNEESRKTVLLETDLEQKEMRPENSYTCPLEESDLDEDDVRDSGNSGSDDHLPKPKSCCLSSKISAESGTANSKISPTIAGQPDNIGLCRNEEKTMPTENAPKECELEREDMETEMMWKLRSNRVEQILSALNEEFGPFRKSKKVGLEFNVGFGPKQSLSVDFLSNLVLLEIARFALAINSSQKDFILEILENNFDLGLHSQNLEHRNNFAFEVMDRIRQLRSCRDAITLSSEVFELPGVARSVNMANQSASCRSRLENAETFSCQRVGLYPLCKEIGLRLHVNNPQPHKKLELHKLTNGAMTEVMNFAEKLCGTFEQICLDILRHNFDLDWQNGDSDLARNIVEQIPATIEQQNLANCVQTIKMKGTRKDISTVEKLVSQSNPTSDACGAVSSQAAITDQTEGSSADSDHKNELNLKLWKLRANQIQQILSIPHVEHCPLYSYSRCKKLGIDFNVGSGRKQNLDLKLLTNGIMVEFNTFSTALISATKHFVTDILEYNFNLNFKNELYRNAFAKQTMEKITLLKGTSRAGLKKLPFELPDMTSIHPLFEKTVYCPKCYQDRRNKLLQDVSDPGHMNHPSPHFRRNSPVAPDANFMVQKPGKELSPTFSKEEEELMVSYPRCKEVGLSLCVDRDQPRDKLDTHVLTRGIILEVTHFAKRLSGAKYMIIPALVEHNFNIAQPRPEGELIRMFSKAKARNDGGLAWFDKVFVIHPVSHREPGHIGKLRRESAMTARERKEAILKRKLALQTKEGRATLPSPKTSVLKSKRSHRSTVNIYPICTEIGLDLDVTSKSGKKKEKLDLQLLTRGAAVEIHTFLIQKPRRYYPGEVFDILDYNFDLSSQHDRRWEFSIATASMVQANYKQYHKKRQKHDIVFKLPFVFPPKSSNRSLEKKPKKYSRKESDKTQNDNSWVHQVQYQTEEEHWYYEDATGTLTDPWMMNVQVNQSQVNIQTKETNNPHYGDVKPELDTEEMHHPRLDNVKMESDTGDVLHLVPGQPAGSLGYTLTTMCPNSESNINPESQNESLHYYVLTEPQGCEGHATLAVCPSTGSHIKTESDPAGAMYIVPVDVAASQEYTLMNIGQGQASASIKEEHENVPVDSHQYEVVSNTEEVGIEQK